MHPTPETDLVEIAARLARLTSGFDRQQYDQYRWILNRIRRATHAPRICHGASPATPDFADPCAILAAILCSEQARLTPEVSYSFRRMQDITEHCEKQQLDSRLFSPVRAALTAADRGIKDEAYENIFAVNHSAKAEKACTISCYLIRACDRAEDDKDVSAGKSRTLAILLVVDFKHRVLGKGSAPNRESSVLDELERESGKTKEAIKRFLARGRFYLELWHRIGITGAILALGTSLAGGDKIGCDAIPQLAENLLVVQKFGDRARRLSSVTRANFADAIEALRGYGVSDESSPLRNIASSIRSKWPSQPASLAHSTDYASGQSSVQHTHQSAAEAADPRGAAAEDISPLRGSKRPLHEDAWTPVSTSKRFKVPGPNVDALGESIPFRVDPHTGAIDTTHMAPKLRQRSQKGRVQRIEPVGVGSVACIPGQGSMKTPKGAPEIIPQLPEADSRISVKARHYTHGDAYCESGSNFKEPTSLQLDDSFSGRPAASESFASKHCVNPTNRAVPTMVDVAEITSEGSDLGILVGSSKSTANQVMSEREFQALLDWSGSGIMSMEELNELLV